MKVIFLENGNTMCFDNDGQQIPKLQPSWFLLYIDKLIKNKIDPTTVQFTICGKPASVFKTGDGYNWQFGSG